MPSKKDATGDVSVNENVSKINDVTALDNASASDEIDVGGDLMAALSQDQRDRILMELRDALQQVDEGFGDLTKPSDIYKWDRAFHVIGATTIEDYVDRKTGEVKVKHIFRLYFPDTSEVKLMMQSTARPRAVIAKAASLARMLGGVYDAGPYKLEAKEVGQPSPAYILSPQPGFKQRIGK